jgi:epoxyqueuosine reductase
VLTEQIKQKAIELGFDLVGVTDASPLHPDYLNHLHAWLDSGYAGRMTWMHSNLDKRTAPAKLLPGAKSVIVVGLNYKPASHDAIRNTHDAGKGLVAAYAQYEDYHPFIKKQLRKLVDFIIEAVGPGLKFKICVDSSPLLERALAVRAGLGFIGKNHMLINPILGPQILLGEIITNLDLSVGCHSERSEESLLKSKNSNQHLSAVLLAESQIGSCCQLCSRCITACPTGALRPDGCFDAAKCISYLTIESDCNIPADLAPKIGNHLFGCSECLLVCPYQQIAPSCANGQFTFYPDRGQFDLNEILSLTEDQFQKKFADSPILRAGLSNLKRIASICLQNASSRPAAKILE